MGGKLDRDFIAFDICSRELAFVVYNVLKGICPPRTVPSDRNGKVVVLLRDGRKLLGTLRSFDQFANVVLEGACERVIVRHLYSDIPMGLDVIRGENVVLTGELGVEEDELLRQMTGVSAAEIQRAQRAERNASDLTGFVRKRMEFLDLD
nr:LOW QUALITY PROTEIN: sm-like protein LSM1B [Coffea arabica]